MNDYWVLMARLDDVWHVLGMYSSGAECKAEGLNFVKWVCVPPGAM